MNINALEKKVLELEKKLKVLEELKARIKVLETKRLKFWQK